MVLEETGFNNVDCHQLYQRFVPVAESCDQHKEATGSTKRHKYLDYVSDCQHLQKALIQGQSQINPFYKSRG